MIYVCERKDRAVTKVCDNCDCGMVIPLTQSDSAVREPTAWIYELAIWKGQTGEYGGWKEFVRKRKPDVPANSIRNLRPLYELAPPPEVTAVVDETRICRDGREFVIELATIMGVVDVTADAGESIHVSKIMPLMLERAKEDREHWHSAAVDETKEAVKFNSMNPPPGWHYDAFHAMRCMHGYTPMDGCSAGCHVQPEIERFEQRIAGITEALTPQLELATHEQKHLDNGSIERTYWHYGYVVALKDVVKALASPEAPMREALRKEKK